MEFLLLPIIGLILSAIVFVSSRSISRRFAFYVIWLSGNLSLVMSILTFLVASPDERFGRVISYHGVFVTIGFAGIVLAAVLSQAGERSILFVRLVEEKQQRAASEITQLAASSTSLMELLNFALDKVVNTLGLAGGAIHVFHRARESLVLGSYIGLSARLARRLETIEFGDTAIGRTAKNKRLLIIRNLRLSHDYEFLGGKQEGFSYMAAVPVLSDGENWGVITLFGKGAHRPGSLQVDLLEQFGEQLGAALVLGRNIRNLHASRDNFGALIKALGDELCESASAARGASDARSVGWFITRQVGADRFDICSRNSRGWYVIMSSEPGADGQLLRLNESSAFAGVDSTGLLGWESPPPFKEFVSGKSYAFCSLSREGHWVFVRLEGRRKHAVDFELLADSFRIVLGLYARSRAEAAVRAVAPKAREAERPAATAQLSSALERIAVDLGRLISQYSGSERETDLKELLGWLDVIQKTAVEASGPKTVEPRQQTVIGSAAASDFGSIVLDAVNQMPDNHRPDIIDFDETDLPAPRVPRGAIEKSVLEFLSAALLQAGSRGALRLTASGDDRSIVLELEGEELAPAPRTGEKPSWLQDIDGRIKCTRVENSDGRTVDTWRLTIPVGGEKKEESERIEPLRVLAVDNQEVIRDLLTSMLDSLGYESVVAGDSAEAITVFRSGMESGHRFGLVIADYGLDRMTGLELARELKSLDPGIYFLLISSWGLEPEEGKARQMGIDMMLKKPFRMEQLAEIIGTARKETVK